MYVCAYSNTRISSILIKHIHGRNFRVVHKIHFISRYIYFVHSNLFLTACELIIHNRFIYICDLFLHVSLCPRNLSKTAIAIVLLQSKEETFRSQAILPCPALLCRFFPSIFWCYSQAWNKSICCKHCFIMYTHRERKWQKNDVSSRDVMSSRYDNLKSVCTPFITEKCDCKCNIQAARHSLFSSCASILYILHAHNINGKLWRSLARIHKTHIIIFRKRATFEVIDIKASWLEFFQE